MRCLVVAAVLIATAARAAEWEAVPGADSRVVVHVYKKGVFAAFAHDHWRVRGDARVKQSALGIKPYSGFGGAVAVKDELSVEFSLTLRPRRSPSDERAGQR